MVKPADEYVINKYSIIYNDMDTAVIVEIYDYYRKKYGHKTPSSEFMVGLGK